MAYCKFLLVCATVISCRVNAVHARQPVVVRPEIYMDLNDNRTPEPQPLKWPMRLTLVVRSDAGEVLAGPVSFETSEDLAGTVFQEAALKPVEEVEEGDAEAGRGFDLKRMVFATKIIPEMGAYIRMKCYVELELSDENGTRSLQTQTSVSCRTGQDKVFFRAPGLQVSVKPEWSE